MLARIAAKDGKIVHLVERPVSPERASFVSYILLE
jgi:hypothetical protein